MKLSTAALSVVALLATAGAANAQLLTNGGFETGDFTGWTQFGNTSFTGVQNGAFAGTAPAEGTWQAYFGPLAAGGISQTVIANVGDVVSIVFSLANNAGYNGPAVDSFSAAFDGATLLSFNNLGPSPYTQYSFTATVTNANPALVFTFFNSPSYYLLDNVSVTQIPAPAAAGLFGLVGLVGSRRRR